MYQQEDSYQDLHQQENIYQQDRELDIDNIYNDFNEKDNEYYSDYDIEEYDDYMANKDDDGIANEDDDSIANEDNDNSDNEDDNKSKEDIDNEDNKDIMQIDNITPDKEVIEGLKLLYLKTLYNFTESAYDDIMKVFTTKNLSLYKVKKYLKEITGLVPVFYDMCENSCICYTGQYESYQNCPMCSSTRFDSKRKVKKVMPYLSVKDRLKIQFGYKNKAEELLYRYEYIRNKANDDLDDIFNGKIYKELVDKNLFNNKKDVAFIASCDGY